MTTIFEVLTQELGREPSAIELQVEIARQAKAWREFNAILDQKTIARITMLGFTIKPVKSKGYKYRIASKVLKQGRYCRDLSHAEDLAEMLISDAWAIAYDREGCSHLWQSAPQRQLASEA